MAEQYIRAFRLSNCRTTESIFVSKSQRTLVLTCSVRCEYLFPVALFQWKLSKESIFCSARIFCPSAKTHGWKAAERIAELPAKQRKRAKLCDRETHGPDRPCVLDYAANCFNFGRYRARGHQQAGGSGPAKIMLPACQHRKMNRTMNCLARELALRADSPGLPSMMVPVRLTPAVMTLCTAAGKVMVTGFL